MEKNKYSTILIKDCFFSTRLQNCLKAAGIKTIEDLMEADMGKLLRVKNFGLFCKEEVEKFIFDFQKKEEERA